MKFEYVNGKSIVIRASCLARHACSLWCVHKPSTIIILLLVLPADKRPPNSREREKKI